MSEKSNSRLISIVESLLFATDEPVGITALKNILDEVCEKEDLEFEFTKADIKEALKNLEEDYGSSRRGVVLSQVGSGYQIRTKVDNKIFLQKTIKGRLFRLSGSSLEVLALVAYHQPCIKAQVDEIRGIESGHLLRSLMEKGLVSFSGKSEFPGKPMLYKTTDKFLETFSLTSLDSLPSLSEMEELIKDDVVEDKELSSVSDSTEEEFLKSYSTGEQELEDITDAINQVSTSSDFFEQEKKEKKASRLLKSLEEEKTLSLRDSHWLENYQSQLVQETQAPEDKSEKSENLDDDLSESLDSDSFDEQTVVKNETPTDTN